MPKPRGTIGGASIGDLRQVVQVQIPLESPNQFGEAIQTWVNSGSPLRARVVMTGGEEFARSGTIQASQKGTVLIRGIGLSLPLTSKMRFLWLQATGNLVLNIVTCPANTGPQAWMLCEVIAEAS